MAQLWYVERGGKSDGPMTAFELRSRAADGRLWPADRVSMDRRRWTAAEKVKGLRFAPANPSTTVSAVILPSKAGTVEPEVLLPGYRVHSVIGSGGCGVVYRATQIRLDRVVALKTIRLETGTPSTSLVRFDREAVALAKLQHPNIVGVHDYGRHDGRVYIAMELLDGEDLEQRIARVGRLDERTAWTIARQTAVALAHAAKLGITHRDIKPANLFLVPPPSGFGLPEDLPMVKVMDFGLAFTKRADLPDDGRLTRAGVVVGTPAYMAPEQFAHSDVDHRADIYALGATVYHSLSGRLPFDGRTVWDVMVKKNESAPHLAAPVSAGSARLVADMLAPDPNRRIADYDDLIRRIDALSASPTPSDLPGPAAEPAARRRLDRRHAVGLAIGLAIAVTAAILLARTLFTSGPRAAAGPAPAVASSGRPEVLSDRANLNSWEMEGKMAYEPDGEGIPVLTTSGSVRWTFRPSAFDRLSIGLDPHRAETVDLLFADNLGLRISRTDGAAAGLFSTDGAFRPLTPVVPYPSAETRDGLVPYLSVEIQRVGDRWDLWFDHRHVGGIRTSGTATGRIGVRTDGRAVRIERVELERVQLSR